MLSLFHKLLTKLDVHTKVAWRTQVRERSALKEPHHKINLKKKIENESWAMRVSRGRYSGGVLSAKVYTGGIISENVRNQLYPFSMKSLLLPPKKKPVVISDIETCVCTSWHCKINYAIVYSHPAAICQSTQHVRYRRWYCTKCVSIKMKSLILPDD